MYLPVRAHVHLVFAVAEFPDALSERQVTLKSLFLSSNLLTTLPSSLKFLTNLTELNVMANHLVELPECISTMTCLTDLQVTRNKFTKLPSQLGNLKHLPVLILDCNKYDCGFVGRYSCPFETQVFSRLCCCRGVRDWAGNHVPIFSLATLPESLTRAGTVRLNLNYNRFFRMEQWTSTMCSSWLCAWSLARCFDADSAVLSPDDM